ncbi:MAG: hypothetical protein JSW10_13250 [Pseudomonadota bacterium]|nr:MAG: hypothetical protein JSW10_13250 [Pseudomonadota bacterium]
MVQRKVVGYRSHPGFETLIQEVYECGHVRSIPLVDVEDALATARHCPKCVKGMTPEVAPDELQAVNGSTLSAHPLIMRLCRALDCHLQHTLTRHGTLPKPGADLMRATSDAYQMLVQLGYRGVQDEAAQGNIDDPGLTEIADEAN